MSETLSEALVVPDESVRRMFGAIGIDASLYSKPDQVDHEAVRAVIREVASPVIAALLDSEAARLEGQFINGPIDRESAAYRLRVLAERLRGESA